MLELQTSPHTVSTGPDGFYDENVIQQMQAALPVCLQIRTLAT